MLKLYLFLGSIFILAADHYNSYFEQTMSDCSCILIRMNRLKPLPFIDNPSIILSSKDFDIYFLNNLDELKSFPYHLKHLHKIINETGYLSIDERIVLNVYLEKILATTRFIDRYLQINENIIKERAEHEVLDILCCSRKVTGQILSMINEAVISNDQRINMQYFVSAR